jgi:hypothetical protein
MICLEEYHTADATALYPTAACRVFVQIESMDDLIMPVLLRISQLWLAYDTFSPKDLY